MPLPTPRQGESRNDFIGRCVSNGNVQAESETNDQAVAICSSIWERERGFEMAAKASINEQLIAGIKARDQKKSEFGYGILTADKYVRTLLESAGSDACYQAVAKSKISFDDVLQKAAGTLVYSNQDMVVEDSNLKDAIIKNTVDAQIEMPKNTLIAFQHILTTPRKDRDGDILRTQGAVVDPKMLLLWQHIHTLPIGKMVGIVEQNSQKLALVSAIVDMNELSHDAAVMVDSGMARFSHGFRALEFEELKAEEGETTSPGGFDIKRFEVMEESIVSVPSNVDAETEEVLLGMIEGGRLTSPLMKEIGKHIRETQTTITVRSTGVPEDEDKSGSGIDETEGNRKETKDAADPSEKTDVSSEQETSTADDQKRPSPLEGSWQWTEEQLRSTVAEHLANRGINLEHRFTWIVATFPEHAVICAEHEQYDVPDEFLYYKSLWTKDDNGHPIWTGQPEAVEIVTSIEVIRRRSPLTETKVGQPEKSVGLKEAIAVVLTEADSVDRKNLIRILQTMDEVEKSHQLGDQYRAIRK